MKKPYVISIAAPSGGGKTTIVSELQNHRLKMLAIKRFMWYHCIYAIEKPI